MKPLILITNDDGIDAPGIHFLAQSAAKLGDVFIVAPAGPRSGMSSAMTVNSPLRIKQRDDLGLQNVFTIDGTPVDCVKLALNRIVPRQPDLLLSGINHGSNAGNNLIYSGTMGAVFEGCMVGISSIGYSLMNHSLNADFTPTKRFIEQITSDVLNNGLPADICLNVNFPKSADIKGVRTVRTAHSHWTEEYQEYTDPHGKKFYWLTGVQVNDEPLATDTDLYWLSKNYATVVPCTPDQTNLSRVASMNSRFDC